MLAELHPRIGQLGPQLLPPLRFDTDGDVVQAPENFLIGTKAEIRKVKEGQQVTVADVEEECVEPG